MSDDHPYDATPWVPPPTSIDALRAAAASCQGCPLYIDTTQVVFGAGAVDAPLILVGEQPGDQEDHRGKPFVGPAGRVLWESLEAAGVSHGDVYATNAVKHFKHELRGKRRIHQKPVTDEIVACHPWIDAELELLRARVIVALGATAARSLLGRPATISKARLAPVALGTRTVYVTYHPSAVLRADERAEEFRTALVEDLRRAWTDAQS